MKNTAKKQKPRNQYPDTIENFIETCWDILRDGHRHGMTVRQLHNQVRSFAPKVKFSTFSTAFFKAQRRRQVLKEVAA
jgi:hypothetical protein